ncbi:hypothetical protein BJ138DRAFT_1105316 [Hygrophoropsis aurantiaca]|uniref:Uncharacterized protein n=1 Tax=Hygrophoropsis aurantiaca TaxID=72124 RepID=A0ACB7ZZE3_9AGAM|nr:hypothetical protein BJ138DRAFT_1105316 [Hygrophoropsis aurantiaca]
MTLIPSSWYLPLEILYEALSFYVNIDQTNVVYQLAKTGTFEEIGSKQVSVIGQEEKCAFTLVNTSSKFAEAANLGFKIEFSNTDTYWSTFELMCRYVIAILVPYWNRQKILHGLSPSALQLNVSLPILRERSLHWLTSAWHAINKPDIVKQAFSLCTAGGDMRHVEGHKYQTHS